MDAGPVTWLRILTVGPVRQYCGWKPQPRWVLAAFLVGFAIVGWRLSQLDGLLRPIRVSGASMSPTLWGPTRQARCPQCDLTYRVHASLAPPTPANRCVGCGQSGLEFSDRVTAGDRVIIDWGAYLWRSPRRNDLVAIRTDDGGLQVKRVVGLPGEVLRIGSDGNLTVGGQPLRPSPEQSWQRSVMVYDDHRRGAHDYGRGGGSRWRRKDGGPWHVYHHVDIHTATDLRGGGRPACIRDDDPANVSLTRATYPVDDLQLSLRLRADQPCRLDLLFAAGEKPLGASLRADAGESRIRITKIGDAIWQLRAGHPPRRIDRDPPAAGGGPPPLVDAARPVALRVAGSDEPRIDRLWLGRSVRYDPPRRHASLWAAGVSIAAGRYVVVGDNPPASEDSRAAPGGIPHGAIVGRVIPWPSLSRK